MPPLGSSKSAGTRFEELSANPPVGIHARFMGSWTKHQPHDTKGPGLYYMKGWGCPLVFEDLETAELKIALIEAICRQPGAKAALVDLLAAYTAH